MLVRRQVKTSHLKIIKVKKSGKFFEDIFFSFDFRILNHENCATLSLLVDERKSERERQTLARKSIKKDVFLHIHDIHVSH